ncbi:MAG TPA: hypothetical protein PLG03_03265, partial [Bacteroidales bacterium]|nr:hypothetical protein [Bacteroidales bacterium]
MFIHTRNSGIAANTPYTVLSPVTSNWVSTYKTCTTIKANARIKAELNAAANLTLVFGIKKYIIENTNTTTPYKRSHVNIDVIGT